MEQLYGNPSKIYYVLKVGLSEISNRSENKMITEGLLASLPRELAEKARVAAVDESGRELLLG